MHSEYEANLRRNLVGVRARGAQPVLLTPVERRRFVGGPGRRTAAGWSPASGPASRTGEQDDTHLSAEGADLVARLVAEGLLRRALIA